MTQAVLFDFGDTLVDYPLRDTAGQLSYIITFIEQMAAAKLVSLDRFESASEFAKRLNTENSDDSTWPFIDRLRSERFFGQELSLSVAERIEREICDGVFAKAQILPDALPTLRELKKLGIKTGIVSNLPWGTSSAIWIEEFARHGFGADLIDQAVCCVDAGFRKPHPAAINECLKRLACAPERSIYVGDRPSDVYAGKAAGCKTALVKRRADSHTDQSDIVLNDLSELGRYLG
ncbi:MAG: HAD family hydrolase [Pseudomonadota bacterium]